MARVQLQKQKLGSMGETGETVLGRITEVLEASEGSKYLELL